MFKKKDQGGTLRHPGECYRAYGWFVERKGGPSRSKAWGELQQVFRKRKRKRRISRIMRKSQHPKTSLRPRTIYKQKIVPVEFRNKFPVSVHLK